MLDVDLDGDLIDRLTLLIRAGNTLDVAARGVGIHPSTFYRWRDAGDVLLGELDRVPKLDRRGLEALVKRRELDVKLTKRTKVATVRNRVAEAIEAEPTVILTRTVGIARAGAETDLVALIQRQAKSSFRAAAWLLERRWPERWGAPKTPTALGESAASNASTDPDKAEGPTGAAEIRDELARRRARRA